MLHDACGIDALALCVQEHSTTRARFRGRGFAREPVLARRLQDWQSPVMLLWGEHDVTGNPVEIVEKLSAGHRERSARIVAGAGHWVMYERAQETNHCLSHWFRAAGADRPACAVDCLATPHRSASA